VGRHSAPHDAQPTISRRRLLAGGTVLAVLAAVLVLALVVTRVLDLGPGGDDTTTATESSPSLPALKAPSSTSAPSTANSTATSTASSTASTSAPAVTTSAPPAKRPPTLELRLTGDSYVEVRTAAGNVLVRTVLRKGAHRTFDQKVLTVVLGSSGDVSARVNGKLLPRGRTGEVKTFTASRK
jgi:cytoskeletal protein RodZ